MSEEFRISGFWFAVTHVMGRLGVFKPYIYMIDKLLEYLDKDRDEK